MSGEIGVRKNKSLQLNPVTRDRATRIPPKKTRSEASLRPPKGKFQELILPPLDRLEIRILGLWLSESDPPFHAMKVSFFDQFLISTIIKPFGLEDKVLSTKGRVFAEGILSYDPADYEKMCLFADTPLIVHIQPLQLINSVPQMPLNSPINSPTKSGEEIVSHKGGSTKGAAAQKGGKDKERLPQPPTQQRPIRSPEGAKDISCCNIDILPLFLDQDNVCVRKRLQPMRTPNILHKKSWDNLPLVTMSITAVRHHDNTRHHELLQNANWMKLTVVGAYNLLTPYNCDCYYTAATKMPMYNETQTEMMMYCEGSSVPGKFKNTSLYPRWESMRLSGERFCKSDEKIAVDIEDIQNPEEIDLEYYFKKAPGCYNTIWGSFHRTLLLGKAEQNLWHHLVQWKWPIEVHYYGDVVGGFSFMGFLDLFPMLYPGVNKLAMAVPLHWFSWQLMSDKCNCGVLLTPNDKLIGTPVSSKPKAYADSLPTTISDDDAFPKGTGADEKKAFVLVQVEFGHPMIPESIPPYISRSELIHMLEDLEPHKGKRACQRRDPQAEHNWQATVRAAATSLRRVPHHGLTDICIFNRQLSESRTRVELMTSFCQEAVQFVNNNFVITEYLDSEDTYQELLTMSHVSMMRSTIMCLVGKDDPLKVNPAVRAARHARQVNNLEHAMELYMQATVQYPFEGDNWRELSTCLKQIDISWSDVCLNKALTLHLRHPLTLLSKGCRVFEEDADAAEPFFTSLMNLFPFWPVVYSICYAYFTYRELFMTGEVIKESLALILAEHLAHEIPLPRAWERELGDFWEPSVLLPGMSPFFDAADLLLRIRAIKLAEVCLGLALTESGESAVYYHLLALCYRLKGDFPHALCLVQKAIEMFGQNTALRCLEGECYHEMGDTKNAMAAFSKAKGGTTAYSILLSLPCFEQPRMRVLLVDLIRRQPSAYAWMALANDWAIRAQLGEDGSGEPQKCDAVPALSCAAACAIQALKCDRRAGRAWAMLAKLVKPQKRRIYCTNMAIECGYIWIEETEIRKLRQHSQESVCHILAVQIRECRCSMCEALHI